MFPPDVPICPISFHPGVPVSQCAVLAAVCQWHRHSGWCMLGTLLPIWWPQWQNPGCYWFWSLSQAGGVADVSLYRDTVNTYTTKIFIAGEELCTVTDCTMCHWVWQSRCGCVVNIHRQLRSFANGLPAVTNCRSQDMIHYSTQIVPIVFPYEKTTCEITVTTVMGGGGDQVDCSYLTILCSRHTDYKVVSPALRAVGNIVTGDDLQTQVMAAWTHTEVILTQNVNSYWLCV